MNFILDNLAIGNYQEALEPPPGIDALLCVAQERDIDKSTHLYDKVPIIDMQPIPTEQLKEAVEWIRDNISNHKIMVFCNEGVGRSPSVVVAYLCCGLGYSFGDAVEYVATRKPYMSILPNLIVSIEETRISNIKDFLKEKSRIIQRKKPKPIILSWLNSDSMKDSLRIIDKKVHYLRKKSGSGG